MRLRKLRPVILVLVAIACVVIAVSVSPTTGPVARVATSNAADSEAPTVGALFTRTATGQLAHHFCTASVVSSPAGDLVITAAHCVSGLAASQVAFVPDYSRGHRPYGGWQVSKIITD
jgi:secreted trypsin-like serine protease